MASPSVWETRIWCTWDQRPGTQKAPPSPDRGGVHLAVFMMPRVCVETSLDVESLNRTVEGRLNRSVEERLNRTIGFTVEEHSRGEPEGRKLRERGCDVPENVGYGAPTALDVSGLARACCSRNEPRTPERRTSQKRRLHTHVGWTRVGPVQDRAARACTPGAMREPDATRANKNGSTRAPQCAVQRSTPVTDILDGRERRSKKTLRTRRLVRVFRFTGHAYGREPGGLPQTGT
jgi:hypothetical protein